MPASYGGSSGSSASPADIIDEGMTAVLTGEARGTTVVSDGGAGIELMNVASSAVIVDPLTGAGWTTTAAASTSRTWTSGEKVTLTALSGATGRVEVEHATPIYSGAQQWDHCVRVDVVAGDTTSGSGYFVLIAIVDATNHVYLRLYQDGQIRLVYRTGGSEVISSDVAGPSAPQRTGGQLWLRLRGDVFGTWRAMWGVGSAGALPTAWTTAVSVSIAAIGPAVPATAGMEMWVGSAGGTPLAATHTVDVLAIRDSWSDSL